MDPVVQAALTSWQLNPGVIAVLLFAAIVYVRGWIRIRRLVETERDVPRSGAFLAGLAAVFVATQSPLDTFDRLFLSAHMTEHILLMMVAPPLVLLGHPLVPLLRGMPKQFVKEALAPLFNWPALRRALRILIAPPVAWLAFATSTVFWHLPAFYQLALQSPGWHQIQHASFFWTGILFWWPITQPVPGKRRWPEWMAIPYLLFADILNTALAAFFVFSGKLLYPSYATARAGGISAQNDQIVAGLLMWVPGSLVYILPAIVFAMRLVSGRQMERSTARRVTKRAAHRKPIFSDSRKLPVVRRVAQVGMLLMAVAVVADGFWGPQIAPLNLAGVLPWIHWRALSLVALLAIGNLFCMACPFTLVRDGARRILPPRWRWPRWLRTKWLATALILGYLWAYEAFSLWDKPWLTAFIIAGYFLAILFVDGLFRGASFCKYLCPIGQFHFVSSLVSPREVRVRSAEVCKSCHTHDCIRGNERARGCELFLFQPKKSGNLDCTFCMDCVKACPQENVALLPVLPASTLTMDPYRSSIGRLSRRTDFAALALVVVFGAFVNAAGMIAPVMRWEHAWHARWGVRTMPVVIAGFVCAGALLAPALAVLFCSSLNRLTRPAVRIADLSRRFIFALVPVGIAMWAAHLLYHFATGWSAPWAAFERILSSVAAPLIPQLPQWLTPAQILVLNAGLLLTLYVVWSVARQYSNRLRTAVALLAPWATLSCTLYAVGVWILFQPMQMRGMVH